MATRRPDLEVETFKAPPYIAGQLLPPFAVAEKVGDFSYADVIADVSAQTGRSLAAAPTTTTSASSNTSFTATERIQRRNAGDSEIRLLGGLEKAQSRLARACKRAVMANIEALAAAHVLNGSGVDVWDILNDLIGTVERAVERVSDYAMGTVALVGSKRVLDRVKKYDEVIERMQFTGVLPRDIRDVRNISNQQLAAVLGVDTVLPGPLDQWYTASATYQDRLAVIVLPDASQEPLDEIQFGRTVTYTVGGQDESNMFLVETYYDDNLIAEVVQARAWVNSLLLNPEVCVILDGCDTDNATSTTTTTT